MYLRILFRSSFGAMKRLVKYIALCVPSGSDCWTVDEKRYFNKGISAYRKDFFLVQKVVRTILLFNRSSYFLFWLSVHTMLKLFLFLFCPVQVLGLCKSVCVCVQVQSKTLAQCVEFYYTYKKQVKVGRSGMLIYGAPDPEDRVPEVAQSYTLFTFTSSQKFGQKILLAFKKKMFVIPFSHFRIRITLSAIYVYQEFFLVFDHDTLHSTLASQTTQHNYRPNVQILHLRQKQQALVFIRLLMKQEHAHSMSSGCANICTRRSGDHKGTRLVTVLRLDEPV